MKFRYLKFLSIIFLLFLSNISSSKELTYGEAAYIIVKYSFMFDGYNEEVDIDREVIDSTYINSINNESVKFLNSLGIFFDPLFVLSNKKFTIDDTARVLGQIHILHDGSNNNKSTNIKLPDGFKNWKDFCIVNALDPSLFLQTMKRSYFFLKNSK